MRDNLSRWAPMLIAFCFAALHWGGHAHAEETAKLLAAPDAPAEAGLDLSDAVVVTRPGTLPNAERAAATVLIEEFGSRTGIRLPVTTAWPRDKRAIAITATRDVPAWARDIPTRPGADFPETRPEGYRLFAAADGTVWVIGADPRGALYGVGALLRNLAWAKGVAFVPAALDVATAPAYPIRGHQLGFRNTANSWDSWTPVS